MYKNILLRRRLTTAQNNKPWLKYGIELEAIESTGTQFIDTLYHPIPRLTGTEAMFSINRWGITAGVYGSRLSWESPEYNAGMLVTRDGVRLDIVGNCDTFTHYLVKNINTLVHKPYPTTDTGWSRLTWNGLDYDYYNSAASTLLQSTYFIGFLIDAPTKAPMTIHRAGGRGWIITEGSNIVWQGLPLQLTIDLPPTMSSRDKTHPAGECGLWDMVSNRFFGNVGTGEFLPHFIG